MFVFWCSFLLLPSTKAVNNLYYAFMALPALVLIVRGKAPRPHATFLVGLWAALFVWLLLTVFFVQGSQFLRHLLYTLLFCLIVLLWVDQRKFEEISLFRAFFWSLIFYVGVSALYLWATDRMAVGVRVTDLPARMSGPVLTSMLIVSCFALLTPSWLTKRSWTEMIAAVIAVMFCVGFVLQSRSGLVGLGAVLSVAGGVLFWKSNWLGRGVLIAIITVAVLGGLWAYEYIDVAERLVARADAGRFELWQAYWNEWHDCGLLLGCGADFTSGIYITNGLLIHHPHNVFFAMGFYHGLPALLLFCLVLLVTVWQAWKQKNPWGCYLAVALLMLNFDGNRVVRSPNEVWLLILLPAMLIAAKHNSAIAGVRERELKTSGIGFNAPDFIH